MIKREYMCLLAKRIDGLQEVLEDITNNNFTLVTVTQDREFYTVIYYTERVVMWTGKREEK